MSSQNDSEFSIIEARRSLKDKVVETEWCKKLTSQIRIGTRMGLVHRAALYCECGYVVKDEEESDQEHELHSSLVWHFARWSDQEKRGWTRGARDLNCITLKMFVDLESYTLGFDGNVNSVRSVQNIASSLYRHSGFLCCLRGYVFRKKWVDRCRSFGRSRAHYSRWSPKNGYHAMGKIPWDYLINQFVTSIPHLCLRKPSRRWADKSPKQSLAPIIMYFTHWYKWLSVNFGNGVGLDKLSCLSGVAYESRGPTLVKPGAQRFHVRRYACRPLVSWSRLSMNPKYCFTGILAEFTNLIGGKPVPASLVTFSHTRSPRSDRVKCFVIWIVKKTDGISLTRWSRLASSYWAHHCRHRSSASLIEGKCGWLGECGELGTRVPFQWGLPITHTTLTDVSPPFDHSQTSCLHSLFLRLTKSTWGFQCPNSIMQKAW